MHPRNRPQQLRRHFKLTKAPWNLVNHLLLLLLLNPCLSRTRCNLQLSAQRMKLPPLIVQPQESKKERKDTQHGDKLQHSLKEKIIMSETTRQYVGSWLWRGNSIIFLYILLFCYSPRWGESQRRAYEEFLIKCSSNIHKCQLSDQWFSSYLGESFQWFLCPLPT